jgi:NAD+ synthase (glutamine-hydrolysing)
MRIAILQANPTIGAMRDNARLLAEQYAEAAEQGADLVVASELAVCGYPAADLLTRPRFLQACDDAVDAIAQATVGGPPLVLGAPRATPWATGKPIQNTALVLHDGRVVFRQSKTLLPTYDVFDEQRYFEPAHERHVWHHAGRRVAILVCEDLWNDTAFIEDGRPYAIDPVEELCGDGADLLICISASPFHVDKQPVREALAARAATRFGLPVVYSNQVGAHDELLFDGGSFIVDASGQTIARAPANEVALLVVDLDRPLGASLTPIAEPEAQVWDALRLGVRDYVRRTGFKDVLIGLSGGIDSAVTAAIAADALGPDHVRGVTMPSVFSSTGSVEDSYALANALGIHCETIAIGPAVNAFTQMLAPAFDGRAPDVTEENLQARARGVTLMALSNKFGALVLTTGNKSELAVGYCTLYGDMCGALAILADVPKTWVYRLANWRNRTAPVIPQATIDKPPSAELAPGQRDDDSLPPYEVLDAIIDGYVVELRTEADLVDAGFDADVVRRVLRLIDINEYKRRQAAPGLRVTTKAFGGGRRIPIAAQHRESDPD